MQSLPFASRLERLQKIAGSQRALARLLGVSDPNIIAWLGGAVPLDKTLRRIAEKTGLSDTWLRSGDGDEEQQLENFTAYMKSAPTPRDRLTRLVERAGLTPAEVAKLVGYDGGYIESVLAGSRPASERLIDELLRKLPGAEKEDFLAGSDTPRMVDPSGVSGTYGARPNVPGLPPGARYVPLLSMAQAGALDAAHDDGAYEHTGMLAVNAEVIKDRRAFAVEIKGDSMEPKIDDGDFGMVVPSSPVRVGDIVLVRTVDGDVMCKIYQPKGAKHVVFVSYNKDFHPPFEVAREDIVWMYPIRQIIKNC